MVLEDGNAGCCVAVKHEIRDWVTWVGVVDGI
jgi:hypothetical protein